MKAVENAPTSEISYYTVNRVCHLETRVLQARSHGQACSREHMHTAKVVHYPPHPSLPQHIPSQRVAGCGHVIFPEIRSALALCYNPKHFQPARQNTFE